MIRRLLAAEQTRIAARARELMPRPRRLDVTPDQLARLRREIDAERARYGLPPVWRRPTRWGTR